MPANPTGDSLERRVADLERRLRALENSNPLNNGVIEHGSLTVKSGGSIIVDGGQIIVLPS